MTDYAVTAQYMAMQWGVSPRTAKRWLNMMVLDGRAEEMVPRNPKLPNCYRLTRTPAPPQRRGHEIKLAGCRLIIDISKRGKVTARLISRANR